VNRPAPPSKPPASDEDEDALRFAPTVMGAGTGAIERPWTVLVVDDDRDVHEATRLALARAQVHGRPIDLRFASSAAEARKLLHARDDIDLVLLDIIMETPDAGLELAREMRSNPRYHSVRVLVRTGQPGFWQDETARRMPGIDGYISKSGLTRASLLETLARLLPP
jgi:CheY-like chemotaxis protein